MKSTFKNSYLQGFSSKTRFNEAISESGRNVRRLLSFTPGWEIYIENLTKWTSNSDDLKMFLGFCVFTKPRYVYLHDFQRQ